MSDQVTVSPDPEASYMSKVEQSVKANHPAEIAYTEGRAKTAAAKADAVEYERREIEDEDGSVYVVEDREDGAYVIARQAEGQAVRSYGVQGLKIDELPEQAVERDAMDRVRDVASATGEVGEGLMRGVGLGLTKFVTNVARTAVDNPLGDFAIGEENVQAFEDFSKEFLGHAEDAAQHTAFGDQEDFGTAGQVATALGDVGGQYIAPAGGLYKAFRAMGAGALLSSVIADGVVGFAGVAPETENIANMIPEDSEAFGALRELVATDPEDGEFENRTRNAVEAMALLGIAEGATKSIVGAVKSGKQAVKAVEVPENIGKAIDKHVDKLVGASAGAAALSPGDAQASEVEDAPLYPGGPTRQEMLNTWESDVGVPLDGIDAPEDGEFEEEEAPEMDGNFDQVMRFTFEEEGGFADTKGDRGGKTQFGISSKFFPETYAKVRSLVKSGKEDEAKALAATFYKKEFYDKVVTPDMSAKEALVVFDAAVHHGQGTAKKMWSQSGGDIQKFLQIRASKMKGIAHKDPSQQKFIDGWLSRVEKLKQATGQGGIKVGALGDGGFRMLAEQMEDPNLILAGGKTDLIRRAGKLLAEEGGRIVPDETALQVREALQKTGKAEGIDFNLSRMETPEQLNNMLDEISTIYKEPIDKIKGGVQTFEDTQAKADLARMTGFDVENIINRQGGEVWPAHKIKAARDIFVSELDKTEDLARSIKAGDNTSENMIKFRRQLAVVSAVQSQIKGVQTETARALSQYRMTAKSPMEMQVNISEMLQKSGGSQFNEQFVDTYLNAIENGGPDAAATFARNAEQVTGMDMLFEAWINSLLGSPSTHAVNMIGNTGTIGMGTVERYAAATYATAERGVQKAFGKQPAPGGITFKEANALAQGQAMSVNDAMMAFLKAARTGEGSDVFGKIDYHTDAITAQNINELPISKTITSKMMQGDELVKSNGQLAHMIDFMGEFYYRLPGRMLMSEDEFFKTINYRGEIHALAAREANDLGLDKAARQERLNEILADPQLNAPELHQGSLDFSREQTFTTPPEEVAQSLSQFLNNGKIGNFPAGRVVVPFFNVINNITKYVGGRVPGVGLVNKNSKTYKDFFSDDPAKRQLVMGKWATGSSLLGFGAFSAMNGTCTGRISDNFKMRKQIEEGQGKKRYACHLPGTDKMMSYNRLEPAGMLMAIAADTANAMAYIDNDEERESIVLAATAAVVPYMQDKSFFDGISRFFEAFNPQYGDDGQRSKALGRYFSDLASSAPGAVLGPLAPNTPLQKNINKNLIGDNAKRVAEANKWTIEKDQYGDEILVANSESYQIWERTINKIYGGTPGLSADLPADVNVWGQDIIYEGGLGPDIITPIYTNTPTFDIKDLKGNNFPKQMEAGRFRDINVGSDITIEQHKKFVDVVGIDGELERLNMPLQKPRSDISARVNGKVVGLPVNLNPGDRIDLVKIMNGIRVPNEAHADRKRMSLKETLNWMIKQPEYAMLPDDGDAKGAKGDLIRKVYNEYKGASIELFFQNHPKGQAYFRKSVEMQQKAQNTGVQ